MKIPKTLLILSPGFPRDENDTACLPSCQTFIKALKKNYPDLNIIVLAFQYPYKRSEYLWHGINVISFNGANRGKPFRAITWFKVWQRLKKIRKENEITGLLSFWLNECALIGNLFGKRYKIKIFTWLLGQDAKKGNKYFSLVKPDRSNLIALSDFIADEFYRNYKIKPQYIIPVGIDISMFDQPAEKTIDIIGAGSLIPLKRYDLFIKIIKQLTGDFPQIRVILCGTGPEREKLQLMVADLFLEKNITLMGEIPNQEVIHLMQRSKVFLHTSSYEGFGTVCAEALYAGCHVISFCQPLHQEIRHWHIVKAELEMMQKAGELLKGSINQEAVLLYSTDDIARKVMSLY